MSQLTYAVSNTAWSWSANCYINYTASYDRSTNKTTITFSESSYSYWGRNGWGTKAETTITVKATDNTSSTATVTFNTSGYTSGGSKIFTGTPSPSSITVTHGSGSGDKQITISGSTKIWAYMSSTATSQNTATGSGSQTETSGTSIATYTLTIKAGANSSIVVTRTSSPDGGAATGTLSNNATIYGNDVLTITFSASSGYILTAHTVNGTEFTSGNSHTVSGNVSVVSTATLKPATNLTSPIIWITEAWNGSKWVYYHLAEIWDGTQWKPYQPEVQTSGST